MRSPSSPLHVLFHVTVAVGVLASVLATTPGTTAAASLLEPEDGTYSATITRTAFGIPHIEAEDYGSLGFGQGYGAADDIVCSLADTLVTGRGERSKHFGADERYNDHVSMNATNLDVDTLFRDIIDRGVVEELLNSDDPGIAPGDEVRAMVKGYVAGLNRYLEDVGGADGISDPACRGAEWVQPAEEIDLWRGIYAANLLASTGYLLNEIANAAPPSQDMDSGLPTCAAGLPPVAAPSGEEESSFTAEQRAAAARLRARLGRGEEQPFGSNGTALSGDVTSTGRGMVLGNPHFPWQGRYRFTQAQLTIPGEYDVRGGMLHGSPVVNIGWTDDVAWTHTVSTAYRFTPYEYQLVPGTETTYLTEAGPQQLEERTVEVELSDGSTTETTLYRTPQGYVLDAPCLLMGWTTTSVWALRDANAEHLKTLDVFHEMAKATNVQELHDAQLDTMGIPWVNTMAADRDGNILYADNSVVPHVTDEKVEQCATVFGRVLFQLAGLPGLDGTRADGACAWGSDEDAPRPGIFGEANLPDTLTLPDGAEDPSWVVNANDSYWLPNPDTPLTGFDRIIGCEECQRSLRTRMVYRYVMDRLDGSDGLGGADEFTHQQLMDIQTENRVFAAELAREDDDLQDVCAASDAPAEACDALADWDGRTDVDSRGAILFREFWTRDGVPVWEEAFDPARPVETPRNLDEGDQAVVDAMTAAAQAVDDAGVAHDAPLGSQQKAGDGGAGDIQVHGGYGTTGNANVISVSDPSANTGVLYPVSYGSSHIQAVAFTDEGVDGCTILTYGQSTDPTSGHDDDQTELWEGEEWVCWPADVAAAAVSVTEVEGEVPGDDGDVGGVGGDTDGDAAPAADDLAETGGGTAGLAAVLLLGGIALARARRRQD